MEYANSTPAHCSCTSNNLIYGYIADIHFYVPCRQKIAMWNLLQSVRILWMLSCIGYILIIDENKHIHALFTDSY